MLGRKVGVLWTGIHQPRKARVATFVPGNVNAFQVPSFFLPAEVRSTAGHSRWMAFERRFYFHNRNEFTECLRGIWSGVSTQFVCTGPVWADAQTGP